MKRLYLSMLGVVTAAVVFVGNALALPTEVTPPVLDPGAYADGVLDAFSANMVALFVIGGIMAGVGAVIGLTKKFGRLRSR